MPTTLSSQIRTIADIVQVATKCSKPQADAAEMAICSSPENVAKLASACGLAKLTVGFGGILIVGGLYTEGTTAAVGVLVGAAGRAGVKRFCNAFVEKGVGGIGVE